MGSLCLYDDRDVFICLCCAIKIHDKNYIVAPNIFDDAFFNKKRLTVVKRSPRHGYCLCDAPDEIDQDDVCELSKEPISVGLGVVVNDVYSTVTSWLYRENGTYVPQLIHSANFRLNGVAVLDSDEESFVGMYLCSQYDATHVTFVPYDVITTQPSANIAPVLVWPSGLISGENVCLGSGDEFRTFDVHAEKGTVLQAKTANGTIFTPAIKTAPLAITQNKIVEWASQLFVELGGKVVRFASSYKTLLQVHHKPMVVANVNKVMCAGIDEFVKVLSGANTATIEWTNGDVETFASLSKFDYSGHPFSCSNVRGWNFFSRSVREQQQQTQEKIVQTVPTTLCEQPCENFY